MVETEAFSQNIGVDPHRPLLDPVALREACEAALATPDRRAQAADVVADTLRDRLNRLIGDIDSSLFNEVY